MVTLVTPYDLGETTAAALRLAELLAAKSGEVTVLGVPPLTLGVHPYWDQQARNLFTFPARQALRASSQIVHFGTPNRASRFVLGANAKARLLLVPDWHQLQRSQLAGLSSFDVLVAANGGCQRRLQELFRARKLAVERLSEVRWDAGVPAILRLPTKPRQLGIVTAGLTNRFAWRLLLEAVSAVLCRYDDVAVELVSWSSWGKEARQRLKRLSSPRFQVYAFKGWPQLTTRLHEWDWCFDARLRSNFGILARRAWACGCPVLAWDLSPWDELVRPGIDGLLIPCGVQRSDGFVAPTAQPELNSTVDLLFTALGDDSLYLRLQKAVYEGRRVTERFESFWLDCLGLC